MRKIFLKVKDLLKKSKIQITILLIYLLFTLIFLYPASMHLKSSIISDGGDAGQAIAMFYYWKYNTTHLLNPFYTIFQLAPYGASLVFIQPTLIWFIISIPFQCIFGFPATYNLMIILGITAGAFLMYRLAFLYTQDMWASFLSGLIFAFAPVNLVHARGHLNLSGIFIMPLFVIFLVKLMQFKQNPGIKDAIYLGIAMTIAVYIELQTAVFLSLLPALWLLKLYLGKERKRCFFFVI